MSCALTTCIMRLCACSQRLALEHFINVVCICFRKCVCIYCSHYGRISVAPKAADATFKTKGYSPPFENKKAHHEWSKESAAAKTQAAPTWPWRKAYSAWNSSMSECKTRYFGSMGNRAQSLNKSHKRYAHQPASFAARAAPSFAPVTHQPHTPPCTQQRNSWIPIYQPEFECQRWQNSKFTSNSATFTPAP